MYRHISMYTLCRDPGNGKSFEENLTRLQELLEQVPSITPTVTASMTGTGLGGPPGLPEGGPRFFDVAQIIDFNTREDCMAYPATPAHMALAEFGEGVIEQVACIDFEY